MMSRSSSPAEVLDLSAGGPFCVCLDADDNGCWTIVEARDHDDAVLTRFLSAPTQLLAWARIALENASLRGPQRVPIAVGMHGNSLLLSMRLERSGITLSALEAARAELLRFAAMCCRP